MTDELREDQPPQPNDEAASGHRLSRREFLRDSLVVFSGVAAAPVLHPPHLNPHTARRRASVRNGVITRIEQNYDAGRYADQLGNTASVHWNPRGCLKGYTLCRRIYGQYRLKQPLVRVGWKAWADDGFPELTPEGRTKY